MEQKLTPLAIFQSYDLADSFLPVDFNKENVLFWRVPEFLENNTENKRVDDITNTLIFVNEKGEKSTLRTERRKRNLDYINASMMGYVNKQIKEKPEYGVIKDNLIYLFMNSGTGAIGSHVAGLYLDFSKIPKLFELPPKEAKRIVDNNLVLANVACLYSAFVQNKLQESKYKESQNYEEANRFCEEVKTLFNITLDLMSKPNVHLTPVFCIVTVTNENGKKKAERSYFCDDGKKLELEDNQEKVTFQKDLLNQLVEIDSGKKLKLDIQKKENELQEKRDSLQKQKSDLQKQNLDAHDKLLMQEKLDSKQQELDSKQRELDLQKENLDIRERFEMHDMFIEQQTYVNKVKNELKKQNKQEQTSKHKPSNPTFGN